jgi:hypothetical protein
MFPVSLLVIGQSDVLFALYNKNVFGPWYDYNAVHNIKNWCMWIGGLWIVIILGLDLLTTKAAYDRVERQRNSLLRLNKDMLLKVWKSSDCPDLPPNVNVRIYVAQNRILEFFANLRRGRPVNAIRFYVRNVNGLAESGLTDRLSFEVSPNPQWLVGQCYQKNDIMVECNLRNAQYSLDQWQKNKISALKWCICVPVHNELDDQVIAVVQFDSETPANVNQWPDKIYEEIHVPFCMILYEAVPELFGKDDKH